MFIKVTRHFEDTYTIVNTDNVECVTKGENGSVIWFADDSHLNVKESIDEIESLLMERRDNED